MRTYELLVILRTAGTEQDIARNAAQLEEQIKKFGGTVESLQNLGRRRLAFRIARQTEGYYYLLRFQAATEQVAELDRVLRLNESAVRFLILNADELGPLPVRPAAAPTGLSAQNPMRPVGHAQPAAQARG